VDKNTATFIRFVPAHCLSTIPFLPEAFFCWKRSFYVASSLEDAVVDCLRYSWFFVRVSCLKWAPTQEPRGRTAAKPTQPNREWRRVEGRLFSNLVDAWFCEIVNTKPHRTSYSDPHTCRFIVCKIFCEWRYT
jgi:hypothetical protein